MLIISYYVIFLYVYIIAYIYIYTYWHNLYYFYFSFLITAFGKYIPSAFAKIKRIRRK